MSVDRYRPVLEEKVSALALAFHHRNDFEYWKRKFEESELTRLQHSLPHKRLDSIHEAPLETLHRIISVVSSEPAASASLTFSEHHNCGPSMLHPLHGVACYGRESNSTHRRI